MDEKMLLLQKKNNFFGEKDFRSDESCFFTINQAG